MQITGIFHRYLYKDDDTGYSIAQIKRFGDSSEYCIFDTKDYVLPDTVVEGSALEITCFPRKYPTHFAKAGEKEYTCTSAKEIMPPDESSAMTYLANLKVEGISDAVAMRWVEKFGTDIKSTIETYTDEEITKLYNEYVKSLRKEKKAKAEQKDAICRELGALPNKPALRTKIAKAPDKKMPSIKDESVRVLRRRILSGNAELELYNEFRHLDFTYTDFHKLYLAIRKVVGKNCTAEEIKNSLAESSQGEFNENKTSCYLLCIEAEISLRCMDALGMTLGYLPYTQDRLVGIAYHGALHNEGQGNTWASPEYYNAWFARYQQASPFPSVKISPLAIAAAIRNYPDIFTVKNEKIYLTQTYCQEKTVASQALRINRVHKTCKYRENIVAEIEQSRGFSFSTEQKEAFRFLKTTGVKILTGGAGTGKTTAISGLIEAYLSLNPSSTIALCAPTGRAAQRMTELCHKYGTAVRASTIHKLLDVRPCDDEDVCKYNSANPLEADMIIVDEMSMVDTHICAMLFSAVKNDCILILCGDPHQLPSVGAGRVFGDMIDSGRFETVSLQTNHRQTNDKGLIIENAIKANTGNSNFIYGADFTIDYCDSDDDIDQKVVSLTGSGATILSPVKKHTGGVDELNVLLQPILNPHPSKKLDYGKYTYGVGDAILMTANNYSDGYVNGDIGTILDISSEGIIAEFGKERRIIPRADFKDISLAYALTIHKSQGSEYNDVIIVLPSNAEKMLQRTLIYTAITRAKRSVRIIAMPGMIEKAVSNNKSDVRKTSLKEILAVC